MTPALAYTASLSGAVPYTGIVFPIDLVALALAPVLIGIILLAAVLMASGTGTRFRQPGARRPRLRLLPPVPPTVAAQ